MSHLDVLMSMADFQRRLLALAKEVNGPRPEWEADRQREIDALEAGATALAEARLTDEMIQWISGLAIGVNDRFEAERRTDSVGDEVIRLVRNG